MLLPIYIFGALANALVSSINSRKQQALQEKLSREGRCAQQDSQRQQQEFQIELHERGYRERIAEQLRAFKLTNSWPLTIEPTQIARMLRSDRNVPLLLVIAPAQQSGIQKELYSMWEEVHNFFMTTFPLNSGTPVVHCGYRLGFPVSRQQDVMTIFTDLKEIPTLYIAPYSTERDNVLGVTVAFWGLGGVCQPTTQNFELNIRKLYIDEIRDEANDYRIRCEDGRLVWDEKSLLAQNCLVFEKEAELLAKGNKFDYLDQKLNLYQGVRPSKATYNMIADKILPLVKLFSAAIVDIYFVLEYGTKPLFPQIAQQLKSASKFPELLARGITDQSDEFSTISGEDFADGLCGEYISFVAKNATLTFCQEHQQIMSQIGGEQIAVYDKIVDERKSKQPKEGLGKGKQEKQEVDDISKLFNNGDYDIAFKRLNEIFERTSAITKLPFEVAEMLGLCYMDGLGCRKSISKAKEFLEIAHKQGSCTAIEYLNLLSKRSSGCGSYQDSKNSQEFSDNESLTQAIEGDAEAQYKIGLKFLNKSKLSEAVKFLTMASEQGCEKAAEVLKMIHERRRA